MSNPVLSRYPPEIQEAINKYENFITTQLEPDLQQATDERNNIYTQISEYLKLKTHIDTIRTQELSEMETKVDLGANFYVKAFVPDTSRIFINVGFGFHLEMTLEEADGFIGEKVKHLEKLAEIQTESVNEIRTKIKMVYQALMDSISGNK